MSLINKIQNYKQFEWLPFQGNMDFISNCTLKITPDPKNKDIFLIMDLDSINQDFIHPISVSALKNFSEPQFTFQIKMGAKIEMHYKNLTHAFKLDPVNERKFYIDADREEIVFLEKPTQHKNKSESINEPDLCNAYVYVGPTDYTAGCCDTSNSPGNIWGWVGCGDGWHLDKCCPEL